MSLLNGNDQLEIIFRDLGASIYERRTGDKVGGAHLRALRVPGAGIDILPDWAIKEGTLHTTTELKRSQLIRSGTAGTGGAGKGQDKGKKGKKAKGKGSNGADNQK